MATLPANNKTHHGFSLTQYLPFMEWLLHYRRENVSGDIIAGIVVAVVLVPQGMAYALLAGMPPETGLYASIAPLIIYGLLGSSRVLSVGPLSIVSLLVASSIAAMNPATSAEYIMMALILALQVGIIKIAMGVFRVGFLVNFLSHPVLSGFTSAAALIIGFSQLKHVLGMEMPRHEHFYESIWYALQNLELVNVFTLVVALLAVSTLFFFKNGLGRILKTLGLPPTSISIISKIGPLFVVIMGTLTTIVFNLSDTQNVLVVGHVPAGLPPVTIPLFDVELWTALLPSAVTIALVGFMASISVAKSLASKKRQKIDPNQELIALGAANIGAAFTGGFPVTGGLGRTVVNYNAGANTGLASIITAGLLALTVLFLTPLFYYLPNAVLAAIIIVAVTSLFDWRDFIHAWHYDRSDGIAMLITFFAVLLISIETGILVGAAASILLYLYRTSRPHMAVVGRIDETEHFRNVLRHDVTTYPNLLLIRVDESLYFPNMSYLEDHILSCIADCPQIESFVLICSAVNFIDSSALGTLETMHERLNDAGVGFYMAEVKGPVMDRLRKIGFVDKIGQDHIFLSTHQAVNALQHA